MKVLSINTGWLLQRLIIVNDAKADAAYAAIKDAMNSYERFDNGKMKSVSFIDDTGEATFKLENLVSVTIEDMSEATDETFLQSELRNQRLKRKIALLATPDLAQPDPL